MLFVAISMAMLVELLVNIEYFFVNTGGDSMEKSFAGGAVFNKISAAADTVDAPGKASFL